MLVLRDGYDHGCSRLQTLDWRCSSGVMATYGRLLGSLAILAAIHSMKLRISFLVSALLINIGVLKSTVAASISLGRCPICRVANRCFPLGSDGRCSGCDPKVGIFIMGYPQYYLLWRSMSYWVHWTWLAVYFIMFHYIPVHSQVYLAFQLEIFRLLTVYRKDWLDYLFGLA